jgi:signal transduction histidine kinase
MSTKNQDFLAKGGEMGALTRAKDWSKTPVGAVETWPQSLCTTLGILLNSKFPMFLFWGPEHICFYNDAYRPSLGNDGKHPAILGQKGAEFWSEIWDFIKPLIDQVLTEGEATWHEDHLLPIYRNGKMEDVYWTFSYSPVNNDEGKIDGVLVICNETTDKVNILKKLEDSNKRYLNNILQTPNAMCIFRGENHVVEIANELMLEIWERKEHEILHKPIFEVLPEVRGQGLDEILHTVYTTGERFSVYELPVKLSRKGKIENTFINVVYEALKEPDGTISGIVAIANDITDQKDFTTQLEKEVHERTAQLELKNRDLINMNIELQSFAYISSHDLQEPLRKIQTFASRLSDLDEQNISANAKTYLSRIEFAAKRMQTLIQDLLSYSRTNSAERVFVTVSLDDIAEEIKSDFSERIEEKNAKVNFAPLGEATVIPFQFRQLLHNLVGNALKFSRIDVPPVIDIKANKIKGSNFKQRIDYPDKIYYHLKISDNGIGFDAEYKERIFDVFQRLNTDSEFAGTGIGLAIVKKIVENHKGIITANGEKNKGATFDIYIPELH